MEAFACGHPRDLWNTRSVRRGQRTRNECRVCFRARMRRFEQRVTGFELCLDCGAILPRTRQGQRKARPAGHRCEPVSELPWQGVLCPECGAIKGVRRRLDALCREHGTVQMHYYRRDAMVRQKVIDAAKHRHHLKRAAQQRGEVITVAALIERDGDCCYLCGRQVSDALPFTHPLKANIDHVVPLSRGGSHTLDNVRVACRSCNSAKGARVAA